MPARREPLAVDADVSDAPTTRNVRVAILNNQVQGIAAKRLATEMRNIADDLLLLPDVVVGHVDDLVRDDLAASEVDTSVTSAGIRNTRAKRLEASECIQSIRNPLYTRSQEVLSHFGDRGGSRVYWLRERFIFRVFFAGVRASPFSFPFFSEQ